MSHDGYEQQFYVSILKVEIDLEQVDTVWESKTHMDIYKNDIYNTCVKRDEQLTMI